MRKILSLLLILVPLLASGEYITKGGGVNCATGSAGVYQTNGSTCSFAAATGTGTVTSVGLQTDSTTSSLFTNSTNAITGSPVTVTGNMTLSLLTQNKNKFLGGPTTGADAAPTFRLLVGADLPLPASATLGGVFSKAAVSHNFLTSISSVDGSVGQAQPAFSDLSGSATAAQLPNPGASSLGGVQSKASASHQYLTQISTSGVVSAAQPVLADLSDVTVGVMALNNLILDEFVGQLEAATAKTYFIDYKAAFPYTINTLDIATVSGTATVAVKIGGTSVTGISAVSVSSTNATGTASAANTVSVGNQVTLVVTSPSTPVDMAYTLKVTRN